MAGFLVFYSSELCTFPVLDQHKNSYRPFSHRHQASFHFQKQQKSGKNFVDGLLQRRHFNVIESGAMSLEIEAKGQSAYKHIRRATIAPVSLTRVKEVHDDPNRLHIRDTSTV